MRFSIQPTAMRVESRPDVHFSASPSRADGGLPRRAQGCAEGLESPSASLGGLCGESSGEVKPNVNRGCVTKPRRARRSSGQCSRLGVFVRDPFTFDDEGQLFDRSGTAFTFDDEHRLVQAGTDQYLYDGAGNRLAAWRRGAAGTRYVYDVAGNLLAEANGSNQILRYYVYGQGLLAMVTPSGASYSYHYDATGNTVAMTDGSQAVVNRYAYTPYGRIVGKAETPGLTQPFQYVGQSGVMAEPNGFYYMRARYYDPEVGRFVSEDPIGFEGGDVNLYAYVGGNPVMGIDPFGLAYRQQRPLDKFGLRNTTVGPLHHDRFLYDNGDDFGYYRDSRVRNDRSSLVGKYQNVGEHLDDDLLRQAETNVSQFWDRSEYPDVEKYELLWHNCQDYCDAVIAEYDVLKAMREFGSVTSHIGSTASSGSSSPAGKRF